jgi:hypothetical protein
MKYLYRGYTTTANRNSADTADAPAKMAHGVLVQLRIAVRCFTLSASDQQPHL